MSICCAHCADDWCCICEADADKCLSTEGEIEARKGAPVLGRKILRNRAQCLNCLQVIESKHRHDWVQCECGNLFVDGGLDYLRRGCSELGSFEDLSEYEELR